MKKIISFIVLLLSISFLAGCATAQTRRDIKMNYWLGHRSSELIAELGEPTDTLTDITGDKIFIYEFSDTKLLRYKKIIKRNDDVNRQMPEAVMICKFWIDESGIIQRWSRSGSGEKTTDIGGAGGYSSISTTRGRSSSLYLGAGGVSKF